MPHESFLTLLPRLERLPPELASEPPVVDAVRWTQSWEIRLPLFEGGLPKLPERPASSQVGRLELRGSGEGAERRLHADRTLVHGRDVRHRVRASMSCERDDLSTLRAWSLEVELEGAGSPLASRAEDTVAAWRERTGAGDARRLTSNWSLMEALQKRAPQEPLPAGRFDQLEELELWFGEQRLEPVPPTRVPIGGEEVELFGLCQTGRAVPPRYFWRNAVGRLLFVVDALWALVPEDSR